MAFLEKIAQFVQDPPPELVFELSEEGIAFARGTAVGFSPFEPGTLTVSPTGENFRRPEAAAAALANAVTLQTGKRRRVAVILPDYAARVSILDFDSFPKEPAEQLSLVRFRLKKTLPFDVDSAAVSYFAQSAQPAKQTGAKQEVVAAAVALEVIARYEALFRAANFHPGEVTTASLAALNLYRHSGVSVIAKLAGPTLTVIVVADSAVKLFRCVELENTTEGDVLMVIHPTLAYIEDELGVQAERLVLCGFPAGALVRLKLPIETLHSRFGTPTAASAGLFGYMEGARN